MRFEHGESKSTRFSHDELILPRSHSWNLPDRLPPLLASTSDAQLQGRGPPQQKGKRHVRHFKMPVDPGRLAAPLPSDGPTSNASSILEAELRLREVLVTTHAWPPSRRRVLAALDALAEVSRLPSKFSGILPMLEAEFTTAVMARREVVEGSPPAPCYFQLADQLRYDIQLQRNDLARVQNDLRRAEGEIAVREGKLIDAHGARREVEAALKACSKREAALVDQLATAKADFELLCDEKQGLERKLSLVEEERRVKEEAVKESQVCLFMEQRQVQEQKTMFREHRMKSKADAAAAVTTLHAAQRMLLRAHHASLRADGNGSETFQLAAKPVEEQIAAAMRWAEGLNGVKAEQALQGESDAQFAR